MLSERQKLMNGAEISGNIVDKDRKSGKRVVFFLVLIVGVGLIIWQITRPAPVAVRLYSVDSGLVESTVSNTRVGTVKACRRAYLAPATGGEVAHLAVKEGSHVKKDQLLMEVWNVDLQAQVSLEQATVNASKIRIEEACALAEGAGREAKRLLNLQKDRQIVSEEQVDQAVTEAQAKRAACRASKATVRVNEARLVVARAALERTRVKAPFDGIVAEVNAELGEFVTPSPPGIATLPAIDLLDMSCLYVSAPIDEVDAPQVILGMSACVTLDAFPERRCSGVVRRIAPYVLDREKQARTVEVEVEIRSSDELQGLLPGYSADIEVLIERHESVLRIPTEAVLEGNKVLVYRDDGMLVEKTVHPGLSNWSYTEILDGLDKGEQIVLSIGRKGVKPGVQATPETAE